MKMDRKLAQDLRWAPALEAVLILIIGLIGWWSRQPLIFASLGATAYEQIEMPQQKSARPYNVIVGHLVGLLCGLIAVGLATASSAPVVDQSTWMEPRRLVACVVAVFLTVFFNLVLRAAQPAALSTTLLVALGSFQTFRGQVAIVIGVVLVAALGEPLRRIRLRMREQLQLPKAA